ncbi:Antitoxin component YwqK of the YwqJK toxin-antitoxin module [Bizionia echini]|uniref:Antitoxin component YwqK of the YwqJK toxin-antitoxin module n=1 Tax=Bizionia echini TaxID=649333 RepID=A0A1I4Z8D3_9FLAO|nr:toxin-antitoxin system YwqK family antitoxin [Bizionia echini]SFN46552.1 Antitoxin component YwqK of the YwqJK toxin-antitoxin module [Bizionia echini]
MKFFIKSALVLTLLVSCKSDQLSSKLIDDSITKYSKLEKQHQVYSNILNSLEEFSQTKKLNFNTKSKDTIIIKDKTNKLVFLKEDLIRVEIPNITYLINSVEDITLKFKINDSLRNGFLKNKIYNGFYVNFDEIGFQEINFKNNDTIFLKGYYNDNTKRKTLKYKNNQPNGIQENFYPNGILSKRIDYSEGIIVGDVIEWFDNGKIKSKVTYENGQKQGEQITYYKNTNSMKSRENFKHGKLDGLQVAWFDNANLKHKVKFQNGKLNGEMILFQKNQKLMKMKGSYLDDYRNGDFTVWNENGTIIISAKFELGKLIEIKKGTEEAIQSQLSDIEMDFF